MALTLWPRQSGFVTAHDRHEENRDSAGHLPKRKKEC